MHKFHFRNLCIFSHYLVLKMAENYCIMTSIYILYKKREDNFAIMTTSLFDILGPITVGPSSSHTAGAIRIGLICRLLLGRDVKKAKITFYGSFAETFRGHGTDKAVLGGLLGFDTDDERIRDSLEIAKNRGVEFSITPSDEPTEHPNTVKIEAEADGQKICIKGISVGGGVIRITEIEGHRVDVACRLDTLVVFNEDMAGVVAAVAGRLAYNGFNISNLTLLRDHKEGNAIMVIETDMPVDNETVKTLSEVPHVTKIIKIPKL